MHTTTRLVQPQTGQVVLPTEYPDYSRVDYWNARYREEKGQRFDWYINWHNGLREIVVPRLYEEKESEILIVGCGNSGNDDLFYSHWHSVDLSERMYEEGYHYITNADFSNVVVEEMRERNQHLDEMDCKFLFFLPSTNC